MPRLKDEWVENPTATCVNCGPKPIEEFYRHKSGRPLKRCKDCQCALQLERYKGLRESDPRKLLDWSVRVRYGIGLEEYEQKLEDQNHRCAICGRHAEDFKKGLGMDHNHSTGQLRDFLCPRCNLLVGHLEGPWLQPALEYLERHNDN